MTLRAVLFDLDGTLADSEALIAEGIRLALAEHGYEVTFQRVMDILGPPMTEMVPILVGPVGAEEYQSIRAAYVRHYHEVQLPNIQPLPGAPELLDMLQAAGVPLAVVTNKIEEGAYEQLDAMGWTPRFAAVIGADSAARPKPFPDPALLALERLGVPAEAAAFLGDTGADMECSKTAGIPTRIGIVHSRAPAAMEAAGATHLARHLDEAAAVLRERIYSR
jgi:phosphoglycolate phosphatase-like HAD superfamily hydrolase